MATRTASVPAGAVARALRGDEYSAEELLAGGFPRAELVGAALSMFDAAGPMRSGPAVWDGISEAGSMMLRGHKVWATGEGPVGSIELSAGTVGLVARDWARAERAGNRAAERQAAPYEGVEPRRRGRIHEWSAKSRANMCRAIAAADWRPMMSAGLPVMVTLTYPGPWHLFVPSRDVLGRHLEAWKSRYTRKWGKPAGVWKIEYQRRGAPHVHLLLALPAGVSLAEYDAWVSESWTGVVFGDRWMPAAALLMDLGMTGEAARAWLLEHEGRHLSAGTGVDVGEGARCRDPRRIAVYFLGHSLKSTDGKAYQHVLPASFAGRAGRWWGLWDVESTVLSVPVAPAEWYALRRLLRRWARANRRRAFAGGRMYGGWVAVHDGPAFASALARAVALARAA